MDGELTAEELRFLLRRLDHDAVMQQTWSRYHMARDGVRRQLPPLASAGFAAQVMRAIDQESVPAALSPTHSPRRHWLHWSAGGAIAASVAVAALLLVQPAGETGRVESVAAETGATTISDQGRRSTFLRAGHGSTMVEWQLGRVVQPARFRHVGRAGQ